MAAGWAPSSNPWTGRANICPRTELGRCRLNLIPESYSYYTKVATSARSKDEKTYLSERFQSANWLVKSLHQRANTILKVASELVRQQEAFFQKGIQRAMNGIPS